MQICQSVSSFMFQNKVQGLILTSEFRTELTPGTFTMIRTIYLVVFLIVLCILTGKIMGVQQKER